MGILSGLGHWLGSSPPDEALRQAVDRAVETVDPLLKTVSGYERKLGPVVSRALAYCEALAADIPGPVAVNPPAFSADPLVHALFAGAGDIGEMLGKSREVRDFFADPGNGGEGEFYALLGMRRREKEVTGRALNGDTVRTGVPQRLLYFADHTLRELGSRHETTRRRLQAAAFDSLARGFAACVAELRQERNEARTAWSLDRAPATAGRAERRQALEERQRLAIASLAPAAVLDDFAAWLAAPQERLYLKPTVVTVDRMGVIRPDPDAAGNFSTLKLPELVGRDRRLWTVLVARISRRDAQEALLRQEQANRYLII